MGAASLRPYDSLQGFRIASGQTRESLDRGTLKTLALVRVSNWVHPEKSTSGTDLPPD
jgi:hypothetical protein